MLYGMSFNEVMRKLREALTVPDDQYRYYVRELYEGYAIIEEERTGKLYEVTYTVSEDGQVTPGTLTPVEVQYVQATSSIQVAMSETGQVPAEIQIIPYGRHETSKGTFVLDDDGARAIMADFAARRNDMVIDYEHQTLEGKEAPASGWMKRLINKGKDGIWAAVEWTPRAAEYLKNREYRYLSPVFLKTINEGRAVRLLGAALTNDPAIDGMVPLVNKRTHKEASSMEWLKKLLAIMALKADATEEEAFEAVKTLVAAHKDTLAQLGLEPGASGEEVKTAVVAMKDGTVIVAHKDVLAALELGDDATLPQVTGTIEAYKKGSGQAGELAAQLAALKARLDTSDAEGLVAQAMKDGKVTPAQKDWALGYAKRDHEGFKAFVAKAPQVVFDGEVVTGDAPKSRDRSDDVQMSVNKALGVSAESFKKFGPQDKQDG